MKRNVVVSIAVMFVMLMVSIANSETINTYNGVITVTPGTAPYDPGNVGTWLNVNALSAAGVGYGTNYPAPFAPSPQVAGSTLDHFWVQSATNELIWSLNSAVNAVIAFPGNDHGPLPMENMEYMMYGSNDLNNWAVGSLTAIYHDGLDSTHQSLQDWYATRWDFSQNFLYFKTVGTPSRIVAMSFCEPRS